MAAYLGCFPVPPHLVSSGGPVLLSIGLVETTHSIEHCYICVPPFLDFGNWIGLNIFSILNYFFFILHCEALHSWHWKVDYIQASSTFTNISRFEHSSHHSIPNQMKFSPLYTDCLEQAAALLCFSLSPILASYHN